MQHECAKWKNSQIQIANHASFSRKKSFTRTLILLQHNITFYILEYGIAISFQYFQSYN